jgi:sigma-B regulation protein RsbU (phosphoserine phosphatase)
MYIMPQADPRIEGYDISGICIPANEVGGDFYDIFWQDKDKTKLGVFVGDVSGKAMQAAMIAVMSSGMVYSRADESSTPRDILTHLNLPLHTKTSDVMFTALCFGSINISTREFTYALAGMNKPLLKSGDEVASIGTAELGLPLGAFADSEYADDTVRLNSGDIIVLYTDGVIEAQNMAEEFYDEDRLVSLVAKLPTAGLSAKHIKDRIVEDVNEFTAKTVQQDDLTLVVIKAL